MKFADEVLDVLPDECVVVAVERVAEATPLPEFEHPESAAYLFGPENGSLDESILERCTHVVCIPGHECLNRPLRSTWCSTTAPRSGGGPAGGDALARYDDNGNGMITCAEARRHGIAPASRSHPAYRYMRDGDGDGVVCE